MRQYLPLQKVPHPLFRPPMKARLMVSVMKSAKKASGSRKRWAAVVEGDLAQEAIHIAKTIADRIIDGDLLFDNLKSLPLKYPSAPFQWDGYGLMQGFAGLAAMYNQLDRNFPKEGWRRVGSHFLRIASDLYSASCVAGNCSANSNKVDISLCSGASGLGYIALQSPRGKSAYKSLSDDIHVVLEARVQQILAKISQAHGVSQNDYDVLYGVTGIGRYLLACETANYPAKLLRPVVESLIGKSRIDRDLPGLFTPHELLHPFEQQQFSGTVAINCGLAHGVPGPLALLSLAQLNGVEIAGLQESIRFWANWLVQQKISDEWGNNWPATHSPDESAKPTRAAWCYGVPGVSRSLFLAGAALQDRQLKGLAASSMLSLFGRPQSVQRNHSPTMCHGRAGILQITTRFAHDTEMPEFKEAAQNLCQELVETFDEKKIWGFEDNLNDGMTVDNPGLLCGASGVLLALLSACTDVEPIWDQTFLLS